MENDISVKGMAIQQKGKAMKGGITEVSIFILKSEPSSLRPETQSPPVKAREFLPAQAEALSRSFIGGRTLTLNLMLRSALWTLSYGLCYEYILKT